MIIRKYLLKIPMKKLSLKRIKLSLDIVFVFLFLVSFFSQEVLSINIEHPDQDLYGRNKLEFYIQKSKSFLNESSTQVRENALIAYKIASANHDTAYLALAYSYLGASYVMESQLDTAIVLLEKAEVFAQKSPKKDPLIRVLNNLGTIYELNNNDQKAFEYYEKATSIIDDYQLSGFYKPRLSLASQFCKRNQKDTAIILLNKIIEDSKTNSDLYFELLARLNLLEIKIQINQYDLEKSNHELEDIYELINVKGFKNLNNRFLEVDILLNIKKRRLEEAYQLTKKLPYITINDKKKKAFLIGEIKKAYLEEKNIQKVRKTDSIYSLINREIINDYKNQISLHSNSLYELSNQDLILEQMRSDFKELERSNNLNRAFLKISLIALFVIIVSVFIFSFSRLKNIKNKMNLKYDSDSLQTYKIKDSFIENFEFCPIFKLDRNFNYQEANQLFYELSGKNGIESLRGTNDFDLPWKLHTEKLVKIYKEVEQELQAKYIIEDIYNCNSEILFLPLLNDEQFIGILGFLLPKNNRNNLRLNEREGMKDKVSKAEKTKKILIVDDESDNIILIKKLLKKYACDFIEANSGLQALDILKNTNIDIVLMDLEMPEMNGFETVKNISSENRENIHILALTAHSKNEISDTDLKLFDDVVMKPINRNILVDKLSLTLKITEN